MNGQGADFSSFSVQYEFWFMMIEKRHLETNRFAFSISIYSFLTISDTYKVIEL